MKITTEKITSVVGELSRLSGLGIITVLKAKQIGRAIKTVQAVLDDFNDGRIKAAEKYEVSDKKESDCPADKWAGFQKEVKELMDEERDLPLFPVEIPGNATGLLPGDIEALETLKFITVKE